MQPIQQPNPTELPLFVFGTLRRGQSNHHLLAGRYLRVLPARLFDFARTEPLMIARHSGAVVDGEIYFLRPATYEQTLRGCDALEGIPAGGTDGPCYRRLRVPVESAAGRHVAWAYADPSTPDVPIPSW